MLTEKITIKKEERNAYPTLPDDKYQVELLDITMSEHQVYKQPDKKEKVFSFQFTVLDDGENRCRNLWANFIPTTLWISQKNGKNKLYQIIEALLGSELTQEQEAKLDTDFLTGLIGKQCAVMTEIKEGREKQFNNIIKFIKVAKNKLPLNDEEKEKCRVKPKDNVEHLTPDNGEVQLSEVPFNKDLNKS